MSARRLTPVESARIERDLRANVVCELVRGILQTDRETWFQLGTAFQRWHDADWRWRQLAAGDA